MEEQEFEVMDLTGASTPKAIPSTSSRPIEKPRNPLNSMMASLPKASDVGELQDSRRSNPTVQTQVRS